MLRGDGVADRCAARFDRVGEGRAARVGERHIDGRAQHGLRDERREAALRRSLAVEPGTHEQFDAGQRGGLIAADVSLQSGQVDDRSAARRCAGGRCQRDGQTGRRERADHVGFRGRDTVGLTTVTTPGDGPRYVATAWATLAGVSCDASVK